MGEALLFVGLQRSHLVLCSCSWPSKKVSWRHDAQCADSEHSNRSSCVGGGACTEDQASVPFSLGSGGFYRVRIHRRTLHRLFAKADPYKHRGHGQRCISRITLVARGSERLKKQFEGALVFIANDTPIRSLQGTTDVYSYLQAPLLASGQPWSPRPIFQSYQAYTPELARLNIEHLRGNKAPDNIAFRVEPIDNRLPALDDGLSWPFLMHNYSLTGDVDAFIYLKKKRSPPEDHPITEIYSGQHSMGSQVPVPVTNDAVFAEIDVQPTLVGGCGPSYINLPICRCPSLWPRAER